MGCGATAKVLVLILACSFNHASRATEPVNLGDFEKQLIAYHDLGSYEVDLRAVTETVKAYLQDRVNGKESRKLALVLDIDETALSNWPKLVANQFAYFPDGACSSLPRGPCGEIEWERKEECMAIGPTLDLYRAARAMGITVFFVTGRSEDLREATEKNLRGVGYNDYERVLMRTSTGPVHSAADFKTPAREEIEGLGYTIVANVGDQPSDLAGGHAERVFLRPDPFYRIP
jgi:predicted secreted acid phosphatase